MNRIDDFISHFKDYKEIHKEEIYVFFQRSKPVKEKSIDTSINRWVAQGILSKVKKGVYTLRKERKKLFKIETDKTEKKIAKIFSKEYPDLSFSIWNSNSLNSLMTHQTFSPFYLFETEADILESTFHLLKEHKMDVFLSPNEDLLDKYIPDSENPIIIKKIVSRSPVKKEKEITHPKIEKILVDIFVEKLIFRFLQGSELINIYNEAFNLYVINLTTMLNYAERRKVKEEIISFIRTEVNNPDIICLL